MYTYIHIYIYIYARPDPAPSSDILDVCNVISPVVCNVNHYI